MTATMTDAPTLTVTLSLETRPDGSAFVPLQSVADAMGMLGETVLALTKARKVTPTTSASGPGFEFAQAVRLIHSLRAEQDEQSSRWQRYVAYRELRERAAVEERLAEAALEAERRRKEMLAEQVKQEGSRRILMEPHETPASLGERDGIVEFDSWADQ